MTSFFLRFIIVLLLVAGIIVTQAYVVGFEYHRFFTPSWFFLALVPLLIFAKPPKIAKGNTLIYASLGILTLYLGLRGLFAELPFLAGKDFPVLYYGLITFVAMSIIARSKKMFFAVLAIALGIHSYQILVSLLPKDIAEGLPKAWGKLPNQKGFFGFFRHYNPFASYCGLNAAALTGLVFLKVRNKPLEVLIKLGCILMAAFTLIAAFGSSSRLGAAVTVLSVIVCLLLGITGKALFQHGSLRSQNILISVILISILGLFGGGAGFYQTFNKVSEQETRAGSGDLEQDVMSGMRISTMSMGYSLWLESPIIGSGPRSYWTHAPRLREKRDVTTKHFSDPEMVHNDYIQTLAEYGVIGLILILGTIAMILTMTWKTAYRQRFLNENWIVPPIIATSATLGIMVHALADFTMHNAATFIQLALILGASYGYLAANDPGLGTRPKKTAWLPHILQSVTIVSASIILVLIGKNQIVHNIKLVKYDHAKWNTNQGVYLQEAGHVAEIAPEPILLEELGISLINHASYTSNPLYKNAMLNAAEQKLAAGYAIHPYRLTLITNLALTKIYLGKLEQSEALITKAFEVSNNRWQSYYIDRLAAKYLILKGEHLWFKKRDASEAMAYFHKADQYARSIRTYKAPFLKKAKKYYLEKTKEYLSTLEAGKVTPAEDIIFFNGAGL